MPYADLHLPPPPPQAASFFSDALDEVRTFVARADGEHSRVVHGSGPLGYEWHGLDGRTVAVRWGRTALAQTIRGAVGAAVLHLTVDGASTYVFGRRRIRAVPGEAVFVPPGWEFTRHGEPGTMVAVGIDPAPFAAEFAARAPAAGCDRVPGAQAVALSRVATTAVAAAIGDMVATGGTGSALPRRRHGEARTLSLMAGLLLDGTDIRGAAPIAAKRLAAVESWIDAHLGEPITVGRLCEIAGVGARSLQLAFGAQRGMSPLRFVAERRLAAARERLLRAGPEGDVTGIAVDVGISHLGRFATLYREAYGESPSQTLRRRPGRST